MLIKERETKANIFVNSVPKTLTETMQLKRTKIFAAADKLSIG